MSHSISRSRGFSLLEALAALALLGIVLPAVLAVFSNAASRASRVNDRVDTLRRAEDLIALATSQFEGQFGSRAGSDETARWTVETAELSTGPEQHEAESIDVLPVQLTVDVTSRWGAKVRLDTVFLSRKASQ